MERAASTSSVLPITPRMSYALKMDLEIMLAHLRAMENFDRRTAAGSVKIARRFVPELAPEPALKDGDKTWRCAHAGSDPVQPYNCAFRTA
jgi:hypothetical protein